MRGALRAASPRSHVAALFFVLATIYLATASYSVQSIDTISADFPAWRFALHGDVTMTDYRDGSLWFVEAGDRYVSNRFPGSWWIAVPAYLVSLAWSSAFSVVPGSVTAAITTAAAMVVLFHVLCHVTDQRSAAAAALVVGLATPTWTVSADALWTHGSAQLWLLLALLLWLRKHPAWAGLAFGAAVLTRPHLGVIAAAAVLAAAYRRRWREAFGIAAGTAVGTALLLVYNLHVFGRLSVRGGYQPEISSAGGVGVESFALNVLGTLVSPSRGVLVLTPFLLLLLPGLAAAWRQAPDCVRTATLGSTAYLLLQLWLNRFSGGYGFYGYRLPLEWLTLCAPLLVLSYRAWLSPRRRVRAAFWTMTALSAGLHAAGSLTPVFTEGDPNYWWHSDIVTVVQQQGSLVVLLLIAASTLAAMVIRRWHDIAGSLPTNGSSPRLRYQVQPTSRPAARIDAVAGLARRDA